MFLAGTHHTYLLEFFHVQHVGCLCSQPRHLVSVERLPAGPSDVCGNWSWANGEPQRSQGGHQRWVEPWVDGVIQKPNSCNPNNDIAFDQQWWQHVWHHVCQCHPTNNPLNNMSILALAKEAGLQGPGNAAAEQEQWPEALCGGSSLLWFLLSPTVATHHFC